MNSETEILKKIIYFDVKYLSLKNELGIDHPDVFYLKGKRDSLLDIYSTIKNN